MDVKDRAQRIVALTAIKKKAEDLIEEGHKPFEVQGFIQGAKQELAAQKPDVDEYKRAVTAASMAQNTF